MLEILIYIYIYIRHASKKNRLYTKKNPSKKHDRITRYKEGQKKRVLGIKVGI